MRVVNKEEGLTEDQRLERLRKYSVNIISWLMAMSTKFGIDYQDAIVSRFPGKCYYCLSSPCLCPDTNKKPTRYRTEAQIEEELWQSRNSIVNDVSVKTNLSWAVGNINDIYASNKHMWRYGSHGDFVNKLAEEMSELHQAYSNYLFAKTGVDDVADEVADLSAWVFAIWGVEKNIGDLEAEFSSYYRNGCPVCRKKRCICPNYITSSTFPDLVDDLSGCVARFEADKQISSGDARDLAKIIDELKRNPSNIAHARISFVDRLKSASEAFGSADKISGSAAGIAKNMQSAMDVMTKLSSLFS